MKGPMIGLPAVSIIGLGSTEVSSASRVPKPPARIATFTRFPDDGGGRTRLGPWRSATAPPPASSETRIVHATRFPARVGGGMGSRPDRPANAAPAARLAAAPCTGDRTQPVL